MLADQLKRELRRRDAMHLQALEGNSLDVDQVAMFEMFERENWSDEERLAHIRARAAEAARSSPTK